MFGSLFDDERPAGVMSIVHTFKVPAPPNRRLSCGLSGIENQGATCYLNSLLQTLVYTPEFREGLFGIPEAELGSLENREKTKVRIIPLQLQRLFTRLLLVDQQAASTNELTESFGWNNSEGLQQHDVQELNRILFHAIDSSLVGTSGKDLIHQLYHGSTMTEIVCSICGHISEREEDFLDLNVIVANFNNLQDSLKATFLQAEAMKGKNQYRCYTCCNLVDATKGIKIHSLPPILTLSLLRFSYDVVKGERFKETGKCTFPFELNMSPYCNKEIKAEDTVYELFSVLIHSGCSSGGHYHAYIRDVDSLGKWLPPDEDSSSGRESNDVHQDPVSLIKSILIENPDHCLPIEFLCGEITKQAGVSWNKKYKSTHGMIAKFVQKRSEVFHYDTGSNTVFLKADTFDSPMPMDAASSADNILDSPKETKKYAVMNSLRFKYFDKKKLVPSTSPFTHHNWFDFNDSRVSPISVKDIEKQFAGKESAYMLFYRRKSLLRTEEAKGNPRYKMSEKLLKLAEEENAELEKMREEYETALNMVNLQVHLGNNYICSNGVLEPKPGEIPYIDLAIDKRKILLDLRNCISKLTSSLFPNQDFVFHMAREVPAGLHLYEELPESKNYETLKDLGILEGTKIFMWDGEQIGGEHFSIGVAHEPVLLNITVNSPTGETTELSKGFLKTTTIGELKALVCTLLPLQLEDIRVSRLDLQGEDSRISPLSENQDVCTLSELSFLDGDNIMFDSIKFEVKKMNDQVTVIVQNYTKNDCDLDEMQNGHLQFAEFIIDLDTTVAELRALAVSKLNLNSDQSYVMRKQIKSSQNKRLPLQEHVTLKDVGLTDVSYVTIEEGMPPSPDQVTVFFNIGTGLSDSLELTISRHATVIECLRQMLHMAALTGDAWHLKKTSWCGEPLEQLSLDGTTLEEEGIQDGESLRVMEGRTPAKGFLSFSIHLYPTLEMVPSSVNMNGLHTGIENLHQRFGGSEDCYRSYHLGDVEISSDSTITDLKNQVLTLEPLAVESIPNIRHLRLQLIDNGRPSRVLKGLSNTLKQSEMLLNVCQRLPDMKSYTQPIELIWDTSKSSSPKHLKQTIADSFQVPIQRIVIAKHFPEKCQWLIIDDGTTAKKGNRKKRWGTGKLNVRNSPYFLKDGDRIGVKDRASDPDDKDDFMTSEDMQGLELIRIAADNKRIKRQEEKSPSRSNEYMLGGNDRELPRHAKKSEVGITIHVDDFT
ncbi:ubiquitin carboxyl-terminal hydrolase 40 isoform X3 [Parasteatoda tepidariorum]|uniref:ubiquitin carboxyl-terminal hydrolase 40 isoform X3 n=1 Tax=Parasteatoda tepidariorum TaxID=114398 RepID=UPI0039BCF9A9